MPDGQKEPTLASGQASWVSFDRFGVSILGNLYDGQEEIREAALVRKCGDRGSKRREIQELEVNRSTAAAWERSHVVPHEDIVFALGAGC